MMLERRNYLQERSSTKEIWNNNWYSSKFLQAGCMTKMSSFCLKCSNQHTGLVHTLAVGLRGQIILQGSRSSHLPRETDPTAEYLELMSKDSLCIPTSGIAEHWSWSQTPVPCANGSLHRHVPILKAETKPKTCVILPKITTPPQISWPLKSQILEASLLPLPGKNSLVESILSHTSIQKEK